jgi:hypothetical protein
MTHSHKPNRLPFSRLDSPPVLVISDYLTLCKVSRFRPSYQNFLGNAVFCREIPRIFFRFLSLPL